MNQSWLVKGTKTRILYQIVTKCLDGSVNQNIIT